MIFYALEMCLSEDVGFKYLDNLFSSVLSKCQDYDHLFFFINMAVDCTLLWNILPIGLMSQAHIYTLFRYISVADQILQWAVRLRD